MGLSQSIGNNNRFGFQEKQQTKFLKTLTGKGFQVISEGSKNFLARRLAICMPTKKYEQGNREKRIRKRGSRKYKVKPGAL